MTRLIPEQYEDDEVFAFASEVVHDRNIDSWTIRIDPDEYLVGDTTGPTVDELRTERPSQTESGDRTVYRGRILVSAGVVTVVDTEYVLCRRSAEAPTDPGLWTSPAGRLDHDPASTARKEFYEELVLCVSETPVFVDLPGSEGVFEATYETTLRRVDASHSPETWYRFDAKTPERWRPHLSTVVTEFGSERWRDELFAFYDESANTLELRMVVSVDLRASLADDVWFRDGEYDRPVRRFSRDALVGMPDDDLVPTDAYISRTVLPAIDDSRPASTDE